MDQDGNIAALNPCNSPPHPFEITMEYMLVYLQPTEDFAVRQDPAAYAPVMAAWGAYMGAMGAAGVMRSGHALQGDRKSVV